MVLSWHFPLSALLEQHGGRKINRHRLLDGLKSHAYMISPMNRFFLALLALFAGIATQVAPAEARVQGETEIGSVVAQRSTGRAAALAPLPAASRALRGVPAYLVSNARVHAEPEVRVLAVLVGPDRARE